MTLSEFLLARIAEDERHARETQGKTPWSTAESGPERRQYWMLRVLAECDAKRRIVEWCGEREQIYCPEFGDDPGLPHPDRFVPGRLVHSADSVVLRFLALPYADHPEYLKESRQ